MVYYRGWLSYKFAGAHLRIDPRRQAPQPAIRPRQYFPVVVALMGRVAIVNAWFRFYREVLHDPKVQLLPDALFKFWINCLCLACENDGYLPSTTAVSFAFHVSESRVSECTEILLSSGLLERKRGNLYVHNWHKRQYKSDVSTSRVRAFRKRSGNVSSAVSETPPDTESEQIQNQIQNRAETEGDGKRIAFGEFGHSLLTHDQHAKLKAELNGNLENFIDQFDRWVHEAPSAKAKDGVKRKDRDPYLSIGNWYRMAVKKGELKPVTPKSNFPSEAEIQAAQDRLNAARVQRPR